MGAVKQLPPEMVTFLRRSNTILRNAQGKHPHFRTYLGCLRKATQISDHSPPGPKKWAEVFTWMSEVADCAPGQVEKEMSQFTAQQAMKNLCTHYGVDYSMFDHKGEEHVV
jgi:hypothetical protein